MECADQAMGKWKTWQREDVLGNCGPVPRNGAGIDDKYDHLRVIEMVSVLNPNTWMSGDVHGLDGSFHIGECY